jgi:hypothetical protein
MGDTINWGIFKRRFWGELLRHQHHEPGQDRLRHEFRAVIAARRVRRALISRARTSITRGERIRPSTSMASPSLVNSSVTVRHKLLTIGATVEHEIVGPHLVRSAWRSRPRPARSYALARPLARHLQSHRLPQPVSSAWAHAMPIATEKNADAPIAVARILQRQLLHPLDDRRVLAELPALVAQRRSRHLEQRAGPPHRETTLPAIRNLPSTDRHAHQFFAATSFMISISRSRSATSFFSRAFSASSCFTRLTSLA